MISWFAALSASFDAGTSAAEVIGSFPFGDFFLSVIWPALRLYLPFVAITAVALWGVSLVIGRNDEH